MVVVLDSYPNEALTTRADTPWLIARRTQVHANAGQLRDASENGS
jgi:hypothetical protein